jgi:hypothetical protein
MFFSDVPFSVLILLRRVQPLKHFEQETELPDDNKDGQCINHDTVNHHHSDSVHANFTDVLMDISWRCFPQFYLWSPTPCTSLVSYYGLWLFVTAKYVAQ